MNKPTEIQKNAYETLRIENAVYSDVDLAAVRAWTGLPGDANAKPTQKGLTLRREAGRKVIPAIGGALKDTAENGRDSTMSLSRCSNVVRHFQEWGGVGQSMEPQENRRKPSQNRLTVGGAGV